MKLDLARRWRTADTTIGTLTVDGEPECFTLEDPVRTVDPAIPDAEEIHQVKVPGATAIPAGTFRVTMHDSPRFGRVPKIHDVPGFEDILMHAGNTAKDTKGCILVGRTRRPAAIEQSRVALEALVTKLEAAEARGESIELTVRDPVLRAVA